LREHGKRVAKIDHLIEAAVEKIIGGQCAKPRSDRCGKLSGSATDYSSFWEFRPPCVFRPIVTARFGNVTAHFGRM